MGLSSKNQSGRRPVSPQPRWDLILWVGVLVVIIAAAFLASRFFPRKPSAAVPTPTVSAVRLQTYPTLGSPEAAVKIIEYGDFGCPTCKGWHKTGTQKQLLQQYGNKIAFIWRDLPIITPQSPKAAEAGQCAFDQNKFWEYHDYLYEQAPSISIADLKKAAAAIGLDPQAFNQCLDSGKYGPMVAQSTQEGTDHGFFGTPGFMVNEFRLAGPATLAQFENVIDPLVNAKQ